MDFEAEARRDVAQTLMRGRDELERGVARGRLALFALLSVFTALLSILLVSGVLPSSAGTHRDSWRAAAPGAVFGAGALYALVIWRTVSRTGPRSWLNSVIAFADIVVIAVSVVTLRTVMRPLDPSAEPLAVRFDIYALAPILISVVFLGCMRVESRLRLALGTFAVAAYLFTIWIDVGHFEAPQLLAGVMIAMGGVLGWKTSERMGEMLDRYSRISLLRSYLPESFVDRVSSDSIDLGTALRPQAIEVTMLVADLRNFTSMSEKLAPAEVVEMLGEYHGAMLEAVEQNGGVVDKFLGDGILVVFGLPAPAAACPPDAGAGPAVRCATAMLERLARLNDRRAKDGKAALAMGIGIHTGPVIAGTIGAGRRREFTVIGDAVNTASRLEGLTKTAEAAVLISAASAARLDGAASRLRELAPLPVKGKAEPLRIYALVA